MKANLMRTAAIAILSGAIFAGCATTGSGPLTTEQRIARCAAMVVGGAVLGGIIGNNVGSGDAGDGILVGAALGGGACAVWLAFQNQADRERVLAAQQSAVSSGVPQRSSWKGEDGRTRSVAVVAAEPVTIASAEPAGGPLVCRRLNTTASVEGQSDMISEVWCRGSDNEWYLSEDQTVLA